jgi:hypothetical protein
MIDFVSLRVIDSAGSRKFKLKGVEYLSIKHILNALMDLGLLETNAIDIISQRCKKKQKELE